MFDDGVKFDEFPVSCWSLFESGNVSVVIFPLTCRAIFVNVFPAVLARPRSLHRLLFDEFLMSNLCD